MFGGRSETALKTTHPDLVKVLRLAITKFDFMIIQSSRTQAEQEADFLKGVTKAHWGHSPHDWELSYAVDCAPLPLDWMNVAAFYSLSLAICGAGKTLNIPVTWGGDFHSLKDRPHFELTDWTKRALCLKQGALVS